MKAILPVAGYGTRLRPHSDKIQKALLPVAGKSMLDYIVEPLLSQGVDEIVFIIGHLGSQVIEYMEKYEGRFQFVEQSERKGLGHAVLQGLENTDSPVIVQLGDTIFNVDYNTITNAEINRIAVGEVDDPSRFGIVEIKGRRIIAFHEKVPNPPSNLAISGLYYFPFQNRLKMAIDHLINQNIKTRGEYQLTDALEIMLKMGQPFEIIPIEEWLDVGVPETYLATNRQLLTPSHDVFPGTDIVEPVYIGRGCHIENSKIGPYVTIMDKCAIINSTIDDCIILEGSGLRNQQITGKIVGGDGSEYC